MAFASAHPEPDRRARRRQELRQRIVEAAVALFEQIADDALAAGPMHRELLAEIIHAAHESRTDRDQARRLHQAFRALLRDGRSAGDVRRIRYFDEDLVLFRTRSGAPRVLDGHCPHLGAHLAEGGRVVGESIRCPFHGWQFDGNGRCTGIPYCERIPPRAETRAWDVLERNGMILVWRHAEAKPPEWEVPELPELDDPAWTEPRTFELEVPVHMQEMHENNNDPVHFHFVHGNLQMPRSEVRFGADGRTMHMVTPQRRETPYGTFDTRLETDSFGLGVAAVRICGIGSAGLLMFSSTSPIDRSHSHSRWIFTVTRDLADVAGEDFVRGLSTGVLQDMRIWSNKIHRARPVLCEADEPIAEFRRWARQFYSESV